VKYLVEKGADVNATNKYGRTLLHGTTEKGGLEIVKYLVEKGLDVKGC
jgi:ankyrin repeat protein